MKIINIYTSDGIKLIDFELNGHFNTMPYKIFKRKYKL